MQPIRDWENIQAMGDGMKLPPDGYQVVILNAVEVGYNYNGSIFSKLEISFDIAAGAFQNFYRKEYNKQAPQAGQQRKWKGVLRLNVPKCDGSEKDEISKRVLKGAINAIESSNPGYKWNWNEESLKGKVVGCLFRNEEWEFNGKTGWRTAPFRFVDVEKIRTGDYSVPADKPLSVPASSAAAAADPGLYAPGQSGQMDVTDDLPF